MTPSWDTLFVCGILCNVLVCLAVRIGFAARSVSDKVLGILLPIAGFVAMGFEHCVANMFFLPMGLVAKTFGFGADAAGVAALDVSGILYNLSAATLGNILGGPVRGAGLLVPQRQTARKGRWRHRLIDAIHSSPSLVILVLQRAYRNFCGALDWFSLSVGGVGVSRGGVEFVPVDAGPVCGRDAVVRFGRRCLFALPQGVGDE